MDSESSTIRAASLAERRRKALVFLQRRLPWFTRATYTDVLIAAFLILLNLVTCLNFLIHAVVFSLSEGAFRSLGVAIQINGAVLLLPVCRNTFLAPLLGTAFERAIRYHRWLAIWNAVLCILKAVGYSGKLFESFTDMAGTIAAAAAVLIVVASLGPIRRHFFDAFYRLHILLFPLFLIFGFLHYGGGGMLAMCAGPLVLYAIDKVSRYVWGQRRAVVAAEVIPGTVTNILRVELEGDDDSAVQTELRPAHSPSRAALFPPVARGASPGAEDTRASSKGARCSRWRCTLHGGQYYMLRVRGISLLQKHPFGLASAPQDAPRRLVFYIRDLGDWTGRLVRAFEEGKLRDGVLFDLDGPHGNCVVPVHSYEHLMLVNGGVGITYGLSILLEILRAHACGPSQEELYPHLRSVQFVWAFRDLALCVRVLHDIDDTLREIDTQPCSKTPLTVQVLLYATSGAPPAHAVTPELPQLRSAQSSLTISSKLHYGRPNLRPICEQNAEQVSSGSIAMLVSGPDALVAQCSRMSRAFHFPIHSEVFKW